MARKMAVEISEVRVVPVTIEREGVPRRPGWVAHVYCLVYDSPIWTSREVLSITAAANMANRWIDGNPEVLLVMGTPTQVKRQLILD